MATQLEKYRHSPDGRTATAREKLKQMISASFRGYINGPDTREARRQIVIDYLNSIPLGGLAGYGEVNGVGDGLWTVYGVEFDPVNRLLLDERADDLERAIAYKQVLSLFIAQRRPSYYLVTNRKALESLANSYLRMLAKAGIIPVRMRNRALSVRLSFRRGSLESPPISFVGRKAANTVCRQLSNILAVPNLSELDRLDLTVKSTIDGAA